MKDLNPWICDAFGCDRRKTPTNGWWLVYVGDDPTRIVAEIWDEDAANNNWMYHACSQACAGKLLAEAMEHIAANKGGTWLPKKRRESQLIQNA